MTNKAKKMSTEQQIISLASSSNYDGLIQAKNKLVIQRMKLDKFFSMFLDKFEKNMDADDVDTPIWKLYKTKLKEYDSVQRSIKLSDYYLTKG